MNNSVSVGVNLRWKLLLLQNIPVLIYTAYANGSLTALIEDSNYSEVITCTNKTWPLQDVSGYTTGMVKILL